MQGGGFLRLALLAIAGFLAYQYFLGGSRGGAPEQPIAREPMVTPSVRLPYKYCDIGTEYFHARLSTRGATEPIAKVLHSAVANAEHNHALDADELFVAEAFADEGPTLKRYRPRARGRATRILKRTSHITIVVAERNEEVS